MPSSMKQLDELGLRGLGEQSHSSYLDCEYETLEGILEMSFVCVCVRERIQRLKCCLCKKIIEQFQIIHTFSKKIILFTDSSCTF